MRIADLSELRARLSQQNQLMSASLEITARCNERCIHCLRVVRDDDGLPYERVRDVLDQLADLGCIKVIFTGGEPFMRRDFMDIVDYAWSKRLAVAILTNGTLITGAIAAELRRLHVLEVQISLYAADPAVHDRITTIPGSYRLTLDAIRRVREQGLKVRVAMPVIMLNAAEVPAVEALRKDLGADFTTGPLIFPKNDGDLSPLNLLATNEQLQCLALHSRLEESRHVAAERGSFARESLCAGGIRHLAIGLDGTIYPCDAFRVPAGHIGVDRIADVWRGSVPFLDLRTHRREHPQTCEGCSAHEQCMWCPGLSLQLTGQMNMPNPQDCRRNRIDFARAEADAPGWSVPTWPQIAVY